MQGFARFCKVLQSRINSCKWNKSLVNGYKYVACFYVVGKGEKIKHQDNTWEDAKREEKDL